LSCRHDLVIIMLIRAILLLVGITLWLPARADAQLAGKTIAVPNTSVHSVTAANGRTYRLYVNLPESYATSGSTRYPVLYLTDAELEIMGIYAGIGYFLRLTGRIRDVILVGVADGSIPVHQGMRRLDYTPTRMPPHSTSGGADEFLTFLRDVAIPLI
jgi:predicted alpha/beta superfamily hydrolase